VTFRMAPRFTIKERVAQHRARRRRGQVIARVRIDPVERGKLVALGYYLPDDAECGALDAAVETYLSDKLAEESILTTPASITA